MEKLTKVVVDCSTGIQEIIELTNEEISQMEIDRANAEEKRATLEAEAQAKATARASALAKLEALGLSADEIASL